MDLKFSRGHLNVSELLQLFSPPWSPTTEHQHMFIASRTRLELMGFGGFAITTSTMKQIHYIWFKYIF